MTYWSGENLDFDMDMEISDIHEHEDDLLNTQVNLSTPKVASNTTGAESILGELTDSVKGDEVKKSKNKKLKLRSNSNTSVKQKEIIDIIDSFQEDQIKKDPLVQIEKDDEIINELGLALKLIIEFLNDWKD